MPNRDRHCLVAIVCISLILAACSTPKTRSPGTTGNARSVPADAVPRKEPRSRYGNGPVYEVFGETYRVMDSSYGYKARGVASWYGKKFHGRKTSNQEVYDMYAMTAAHKTLPLPTYVRVRNLRNNRSIIVRVNDRGPFVDNRLIDLSYSAALRLDMVRDGTSLVEVTAISFDEPPREKRSVTTTARSAGSEPAGDIFVQVGAFSDKGNAQRRYAMLRQRGFEHAFVDTDSGRSPALYRVRIGPIADVVHYDSIVEELQRLGIRETHLVTN